VLDNLLLMEIIAEQKRQDIEGRIERGHVAEIASAQSESYGLRAAAAAALVRFGILLDGTAGRRAAAPQH
jgi:hypothetical protein